VFVQADLDEVVPRSERSQVLVVVRVLDARVRFANFIELVY